MLLILFYVIAARVLPGKNDRKCAENYVCVLARVVIKTHGRFVFVFGVVHGWRL